MSALRWYVYFVVSDLLVLAAASFGVSRASVPAVVVFAVCAGGCVRRVRQEERAREARMLLEEAAWRR